jgi:hypothetical protein
MEKPLVRRKQAVRARLYRNGQYHLEAVLEFSGVTLKDLYEWRSRSAPRTGQKRSNVAVASLRAELAHLRRERRAIRDAIASLAKASTCPKRSRKSLLARC